MRRVIVNIDSLVLKGFRYEDRHAVAAAVQDEITRALGAPDAGARIAQLGSTPKLRIGDVNGAADAEPRQVGAAAGRAVGQGMMR
jgi:hypothetical protein